MSGARRRPRGTGRLAVLRGAPDRIGADLGRVQEARPSAGARRTGESVPDRRQPGLDPHGPGPALADQCRHPALDQAAGQRADLNGGLAWTGWQGGKLDLAGQEAASALRLDARDDLGRLVSMVLALHAGRVDEAWPLLDGLLADQAFRVEARFQVAAAALETLAQRVPESPWPYLVLARIFQANGRPDAAQAAIGEFLRRNADPVWRQRVEAEFGIKPGA